MESLLILRTVIGLLDLWPSTQCYLLIFNRRLWLSLPQYVQRHPRFRSATNVDSNLASPRCAIRQPAYLTNAYTTPQ
ncbi:hypothetical protein GALMADRAFT_1051700 [Galerina marginata CBS 339.88]|uniref:Secreted protein n=1 Tax=Galerina marginata (strain CBS 339.88) TaxID=685588 RepID=A0A067SDN0_GALM3|nr:hypothetical protein GALMADRAFT_1051700 [Galerina marginata CBS 339.88]